MQCTQNINQNIEFVNIHFRLSCYQKTTLTGDKKSQDGFSPYFFKGAIWICNFLHQIWVRSVNWAPRNQENKVGAPKSTRSFENIPNHYLLLCFGKFIDHNLVFTNFWWANKWEFDDDFSWYFTLWIILNQKLQLFSSIRFMKNSYN